MGGQSSGLLRIFVAGLAIFTATIARATTIDVTIDTSFLNGVPAVLAFDFIDGGPPGQQRDAERAHVGWNSVLYLDHRQCHRRRAVDVLRRRWIVSSTNCS